jgi:hypothetical protein
MKRLLRLFLSAATLLSLLLCVAMLVLWARSYRVGEAVHYMPLNLADPLADDEFYARSGKGGVRFTHDKWAAWELGTRKPSRPFFDRQLLKYYAFPPTSSHSLNRTWFDHWGFEWSGYEEPISPTSVGSGIVYERNLVIPYWALAAVTGALPFASALRWRRRRLRRNRAAHGLCPTCGYDLRATPERCPECGFGAVSPAVPPPAR